MRLSPVVVILCITLILIGCNDASTPSGTDNSAPSFAGVTSVDSNGLSGIIVHWNAADDASGSLPQDITYKVYVRSVTDEPFDPAAIFNSPTVVVTTEKGALRQHVENLNSNNLYEIGVRAVDESGNEDSNLIVVAQRTNAQLDYETMVQPIFTANCATSGCHTTQQGNSPAAGLNLDPGQSQNSLFQTSTCNMKNFITGAGDDYLLLKLNNDPSICGVAMPKDADPLDSAFIQIIWDWILSIAA